jgi:eukaryotic-like serine/threonine-protein kinase
MARAGDAGQAEKLATELASQYPLDTLLNSYRLPVIRASVEIQRINAARAAELLEGAKRYELASPDTWPGMGAPVYPIYLRGECLLREHQGGEAATEFQKLLEHRGLRRASPLGPRAQLGLARAYAMAGEAAQAKAGYQEFFTLWKDADTGVSLVTEANTEYRKLE